MESLIIDLEHLYCHAERDKGCESLPLKTRNGRELGKKITKLFSGVQESAGIYVWYDSQNQNVIYAGKSTKRKTSNLRARLVEELKEERAFLWAGKRIGIGVDKIHSKWQEFYPDIQDKGGGRRHIDRAIRKSNSTHVIVISLPALNEEPQIIGSIEAHVIQHFKLQECGANARAETAAPEQDQTASKVIDLVEKAMEGIRDQSGRARQAPTMPPQPRAADPASSRTCRAPLP